MNINISADTHRQTPVEQSGITHTLSKFVSDLRPENIPEETRRILHAAVIDAIGCGLYGLTTEPCAIVSSYAADQGGPSEASYWAGGGGRGSITNVALAACTAVHGFDFDDHSRAKIHPGAAIIPSALALAEREGSSGKAFMTAIAAGYEVMNRISLAADPSVSRMRGWHLTGTIGTFGVAAAASSLLGFDTDTTASALGLAGTQSSGLWAFTADGAMSKRLHPGLAGRSGLMAAELAARGFHGPRKILEAEDGGFLAATSDQIHPSEISDGLGEVWRTDKTCFKPYACCGSNHAAIDALLSLKAENDLAPEMIDRITVGVSKVVERQTGFAYSRSSVLNAQMSIRYNLAVAMLDGNALVEQFTPERIAEAKVNELAGKVDVVVDADMDAVYPRLYAGIVTLTLKDGQRLTRRIDHSKGMPEAPMSLDEIRMKFLSLASAAIGDLDAETLLTDIAKTFELDNVGTLGKRLGALLLQD